MKTDLTNEILNIIEKEVAPDSQDYIVKQLNELFASLNPERVKIAFNEIRNEITAIAEYIDSKGGIDGIGQLEDLSAKIDNINISDLCFGSQEKVNFIMPKKECDKLVNEIEKETEQFFGSQEKEEYIDKSISIDEYMNMNPEIDPLEQNNKRNFPGAYMGDETFNQPE